MSAHENPDLRHEPHAPETVCWQDGQPFSPRYDDRYHTLSGARAQNAHVFLGGCGLPDAWAGQAHWCILETGFGLGLSFLSTWACWLDDPARPPLLRFVSTEAHPVNAEDIRRAAAHDSALQALAERLATGWQAAWPGQAAPARPVSPQQAPPLHHVFSQPEGRVELLILAGDSGTRLRAWHEEQGPLGADSVFLDGFDPKKNPAMWSAGALQQVAAHCRPGARIATWCVARAVRDAATAAGFSVYRRPGLSPKRHCLAGTLNTPASPRALLQA